MSAQATIQHKIVLGVRLLDSITGTEIAENNVRFFSSEKIPIPLSKTPGTFFFLNMEKVNMKMEVHVYGYEHAKVFIDYSKLDERLPMQDIYFIPKQPKGQEQLLTLEGNYPGIESIEAVSTNDASCFVKEYDARKRIMTLFNPHNVMLTLDRYGLLNQRRDSFETLEILKEISRNRIKINASPEKEIQTNQGIVRIIPGKVEEDGSYLIRVFEEEDSTYLVRYVADQKVYFETIDFKQSRSLGKGGE